jgi:hypothetical protein
MRRYLREISKVRPVERHRAYGSTGWKEGGGTFFHEGTYTRYSYPG